MYVGVAVRIAYTGHSEGINLVWNLVLAWVPLSRRSSSTTDAGGASGRPYSSASGFVWLLFFPNAPHILTDLQHVPNWHGAPTWFDTVLVGSAAWTGLLLGFASPSSSTRSFARSFAAVAWAPLSEHRLASFGVYSAASCAGTHGML